MIRAHNIAVSFDLGGGQEHSVLRDLSLEVERGQTVSIIGPTGQGRALC